MISGDRATLINESGGWETFTPILGILSIVVLEL